MYPSWPQITSLEDEVDVVEEEDDAIFVDERRVVTVVLELDFIIDLVVVLVDLAVVLVVVVIFVATALVVGDATHATS